MSSGCSIVTVEARPLAVVRARLPYAQVGTRFGPLLDQVWAAIRSGALQQRGHNIFVYRPIPGGQEADMEFGVEVAGPFPAIGDVVSSATPAGRALHTTHVGAYQNLHRTFEALFAYGKQQQLTPKGINWEIYGDWVEDQAQLRTDVYILLEG